MIRRATSTMQVSSSITTTPPEPSIEPAFATESKSIATLISSAVNRGQELPPGMTACGFFPAFVCARAGMRHQIEIESAPEDVLAQIAAGIGFGNCLVHDFLHVAVLAADINEPLVRSHSATR